MEVHWLEWRVVGPPKLQLTREEVILAISSNDKHLRQLIKDGKFPPGIQETPKAKTYWYALDVACYLYLRSRGMSPGASDDED